MAPTKLPDAWIKATVSEINDYKPSSMQPKNHQGDVFELFSVPIFPEGRPEVLKAEDIGSSKQFVNCDDVLVCKINPRINRVWCIPHSNSLKQIASSEWIVIRQSNVHSNFLTWYFRSENFRTMLCADVTGVGGSLTRAQPKKVATFEVPFPPLAEQKVIAEKLDTLLAQVETTKARLESTLETLKQFRQSVLAAAVSGKLTEDWRGLHEKYVEFCGYTVPASWLNSSIGNESEYVTSGSRGWAKYYSDSGALFIRSQDINSDELNIQNAAYVQLPDKIEGQRTKVQINDLLVTITGANVTKCARLKTNLDDAYISQHVALIRLKSPENSAFFELVLKALNAGRKQLNAMAYGGGKPGLNLQNIKDVEFAKPSSSIEADEIVRRVNKLFAGADITEQLVNQALERINNLTQSILAKAFRGELTEQWRKDNPELISADNSAEALLRKIKAERAAAKSKKQ
ncbi:restriction endonuclease subunit S [Vibrio rumoiensis]|uniref:restriction endonuclease subunit S n=1 Tax=Vibrio rumoiensis TaxID=76258 RepID=UPI000B5C8C1A|nr:restriction endonuclease subunit S [Vibrio rumoiensis]